MRHLSILAPCFALFWTLSTPASAQMLINTPYPLLAALGPASSQMPAVSAPTVGSAPASFDIQDLSLPAVAGQSFELRLKLGGHERGAPPAPSAGRRAGSRVLAGAARGAREPRPYDAVTTYRGEVDGLPGAQVAASLFEGGLYALVLGDPSGSAYFVEPAAS